MQCCQIFTCDTRFQFVFHFLFRLFVSLQKVSSSWARYRELLTSIRTFNFFPRKQKKILHFCKSLKKRSH